MARGVQFAVQARMSLQPFFEPGTVAVVGVSRRRGRIGSEIFHNLASGGFRGRVLPVNPAAVDIDGVPAYPRVVDIPGGVDLAVIAVSAPRVSAAIDDCLAKRVPAVVVISAGFAEAGEDGRALEADLVSRVRAAGVRMIGPNCMGVINTDPAVQLNATFSPVCPPAGRIAFSSQSGALGLAILDYARRLNLGISSFVSVGNKADVSTNDLIEYWADDPRTDVILLYVESFGNPRRFSRIAREVARRTPIVAVKAGRSRAGARAATSHTGALASTDSVVDALFRESGVIRTDTLEEMFDAARLLACQRLPAGRAVAILTNAGGPGILAADACEGLGLTLPAMSPATVERLRSFLPACAGLANPVDMLATASADDYRRAIPLILADPAIDSLLTIFIPPLVTNTVDAARAIADTAGQSAKPILATFLGAEGAPEALAPVPCYAFPESAARALASVVRYARWRSTPAGVEPVFRNLERAAARAIVEHPCSSDGGWLSPLEAYALLDALGISRAPTFIIASESDAIEMARRLGFPVVLKGAGPALLHKTEARAVLANLADEAAVCRAYHTLSDRRAHDVHQILMQPMVLDGVELFIGATLDPTFGHVVMCGGGGTMVELLHDASSRLHPLTEVDAREMISRGSIALLLRGFRGAPPADGLAFRDMLLRVSALITLCPEVTELDLNPVIVTATGAVAVDVRVRVGNHRLHEPRGQAS